MRSWFQHETTVAGLLKHCCVDGQRYVRCLKVECHHLHAESPILNRIEVGRVETHRTRIRSYANLSPSHDDYEHCLLIIFEECRKGAESNNERMKPLVRRVVQ
ncbi:hypothetical protein AB6A40_007695 [Gnathostoma spinigerum]|uniref:Uncharacterized protein n=1 Tax=Gnathostoma spinigerum TaxID=75299 RepID=A0ABD6ENW9_9BILA